MEFYLSGSGRERFRLVGFINCLGFGLITCTGVLFVFLLGSFLFGLFSFFFFLLCMG